MEKYLADRTSLIDASGIRKVFSLAASLENPVNLSIGQPDFDVPDPVKDAAIDAIRSGANSYTQTAGDAKLKSMINDKVRQYCGWSDAPDVLVTSGVSGALLLAFMATINPGDEVIIPDPYFVIYKHTVNMLGGKCIFVDSYPDFNLPIGRIKEAITPKTKMIIVNSPTNPTGCVYSDDELKELSEIAGKNDTLILTDEIYDVFSYDRKCPSIASYYDKTLLLKGFSKTCAMTGWRMAYVAGLKPVSDVIEQMTKIQQYTFVCAPTPFQKAAIVALETDVSGHVDNYRRKRDMLYDGLKDHYEITKPSGAFYAFVKSPDWASNGDEFVETAIKNNLLVIPGSVFSEKDSHFRISYATSDEKLREGIEILQKLAKR